MKKTLSVALFLLLVTPPHLMYAATLIESQESNAGLQKTWIDGEKLRVSSEAGSQYMLLNFIQKTMHIVYPDKMQIMDMSKAVGSFSSDTPDSYKQIYTVKKKGKGPIVAGFQTEHYIVSHKGIKCFESYTSMQAVKEMGLEQYLSGMREMFPRENSPDTKENPCINAENALDYEKIGIPLMLIEEDGTETYRISKIEKNVPLPEGGFSIPEKFSIIDYGQMVQHMMQPGQN